MNTTRQSVNCSVALVWASRRSAANRSAAASTRQRSYRARKMMIPMVRMMLMMATAVRISGRV